MNMVVKYPIGEQSFEKIREMGGVYVDKTRFIEDIVMSGSQFIFLGRPRRFGKSLFLSTLKSFFSGRRDLFKGLYIDKIDWTWDSYPVLLLDLNIERYKTAESLNQVLDHYLLQWEQEYSITKLSDNLSIRFSNVIKGIYNITGKRVVVLVDEYDKPLVNNIHNRELFEDFRDTLAAVYSNFKSSTDYLRLVFLTGVSRFAHLSVFSGLNNINDISFYDKYSDICGITGPELTSNFEFGLSKLAEAEKSDYNSTLAKLKQWYDGYRFSAKGVEIYNPFSILNIMEGQAFKNYWIQSGQPTLLLELLKKYDIDLESLFNYECDETELQGFDINNTNPAALLYQTGYLTIKESNRELLRIGIPNEEVRTGLLLYLLPYYANNNIDQLCHK